MAVKDIPSRAAVKTLESISSGLWDLKANLMTDIVEQHGPAKSVAWFARNMPTYEKILKAWGPLRTHYLAVAISVTNGCAYCTYGHAYAFVLHYFEEHDRLFPLTEEQMRDAGALDRHAAIELLTSALIEADMAHDLPWLDRTLEFAANPAANTPADQDGKWMVHLVQMFGFLNACGIAAETTPDAAHDPINKDIDLRERYAAKRSAP